MPNVSDTTNPSKLHRRAVLTGLAALSTAGTVTLARTREIDPLDYHLAEAVKLLQARDSAFQWDISHFNGGRLQAVTLSAWRVDP